MHGSAQVEALRREMHHRLELDGPGALREVDGGGPGTARIVGVQAPDRGASAGLREGEARAAGISKNKGLGHVDQRGPHPFARAAKDFQKDPLNGGRGIRNYPPSST